MAKKKARRKADDALHAESTPSFEDSLAELQEIVARLEDGSAGLEDSMQDFERGVSLLRICGKILNNAEQKIEMLTGFDAGGNPTTEPFDATATTDQSQPQAGRRNRKNAKDDEEPDDTRLFS